VTSQNSDNRTRQFVSLLGESERRLGSYVLALVPNWCDAEEVLQETRLRLWEQFESYDPSKDFGAWACTVAYYQVLKLRSHTARSKILFSQETVDRVSAELARVAPKLSPRLSILLTCIEKLSSWQRDLLKRCCMSGDSVAKASAGMNRKVDSTRKVLLRIRRKLHECVEIAMNKEDRQ
jgi:RNA polymerase sigma-70 factor, ECF subfamily